MESPTFAPLDRMIPFGDGSPIIVPHSTGLDTAEVTSVCPPTTVTPNSLAAESIPFDMSSKTFTVRFSGIIIVER